MRISDWSSDVCSSDLGDAPGRRRLPAVVEAHAVDDRAVLDQPEQARARIAGLRQRGQRADLDETEAEMRHRMRDTRVLVETGREAHRVGQGEARQPGSRSEEPTSELQYLMPTTYAGLW